MASLKARIEYAINYLQNQHDRDLMREAIAKIDELELENAALREGVQLGAICTCGNRNCVKCF